MAKFYNNLALYCENGQRLATDRCSSSKSGPTERAIHLRRPKEGKEIGQGGSTSIFQPKSAVGPLVGREILE